MQFTVYIVDDDQSVLAALDRLLRSAGWRTQVFRSPLDFLRKHDPDAAGCVLLDLHMPEMTGRDVQINLLGRNCKRPIIFMSGHEDIFDFGPTMKATTIDFLRKPIEESLLFDAISRATAADEKDRRKD